MRDESVHAALLAEQMKHEPHRLTCEARYMARLDPVQRREYLSGVAKLRGREAAEALRAAMKGQK